MEERYAAHEALLAQDRALLEARWQLVHDHETAQRLAQSEAWGRSLEAVVFSAQEELRRVRDAAGETEARDAAYEALVAENRALLEARWRLIHRLEMPDGPRLLRMVLPALRAVRRLVRRGRGHATLPPDLGSHPPILPAPAPSTAYERLGRSVESALITLALRGGQQRS
jgi:hypothetical protein